MLAISLRPLLQRAEFLLAFANAGFGSLFWLIAAFVMSSSVYGAMMSVQAAVLVVVMAFSLRTHDLFFFLIDSNGMTAKRTYFALIKFELFSVLASSCLVAVASFIYFAGDITPALAATLFALAASLGSSNGTAVAEARFSRRNREILIADAICLAFWLAALGAIVFGPQPDPSVVLVIGAVPLAARTAFLIVRTARMAARQATPGDRGPSLEHRRTMITFLAAGQSANFLKNASISIETVLVALFFNPATVALYRIARAALGLSSSALNVTYQRTFPKLAAATSREETSRLARLLERRSLLLQLCAFPVASGIGYVYATTHPEVSHVMIQLVTAGLLLSLLPVALQQGVFAVLNLKGRHHQVSFGYVLALAGLALAALATALWPRLWVFIAGLTLANFLRLAWLRRQYAQLVAPDARELPSA